VSFGYYFPVLRGIVIALQNLLFQVFYGKYFPRDTKICGFPIVAFSNGSQVEIGKNLVMISASYFSEPGVNHPVILRTLNENARLVIGSDVGMSGGGICAAKEVIIGDNVMMGANSFITDTDFHPLAPEGRRHRHDNTICERVEICSNVFLGMNVLVLKGVKIGTNSVIGAGSVVTSDIPENCIAAGVPARLLRRL